MDESLQELENELGNLRPHAVSPALSARVEAAMAEPSRRSMPPTVARERTVDSPDWFGWPLAAAAALVLLASAAIWRGWSGQAAPSGAPGSSAASPAEPTSAAASAPGHYRPVGAASVLYDLTDDGTVYLSDRTPAHRLRYKYVDTYTWKNPATNASLKWSVPREEIRVLPASLH